MSLLLASFTLEKCRPIELSLVSRYNRKAKDENFSIGCVMAGIILERARFSLSSSPKFQIVYCILQVERVGMGRGQRP